MALSFQTRRCVVLVGTSVGPASRRALTLLWFAPLWTLSGAMLDSDTSEMPSDHDQQVLESFSASHHVAMRQAGVDAPGSCEVLKAANPWCGNSDKEKELALNKYRMGIRNGARAVSIMTGVPDKCSLYLSTKDSLQDAEQEAMDCCRTAAAPLGGGGHCELVGPQQNDSMHAWCEYARAEYEPAESGEGHCKCPPGVPMMIGGLITPPDASSQVAFNAKESLGTCVDVCFAKAVKPNRPVPLSEPNWPVVLLAVYNLGLVVHSNPVFCPNTDLLSDRLTDACYKPHAAGPCDMDVHSGVVASGRHVPDMLQRLGCRELIFDSNHGGGTWVPPEHETGCWSQGQDSESVFRSSLKLRDYRQVELYWLTSENTRPPFAAAQHEEQPMQTFMESCFGSLGQRLDFNPLTYSLLHHNCNKFSVEVMRELGLPKFYPENEKGLHPKITFSATLEENVNGWRQTFPWTTSKIFGSERSKISAKCKREFHGKIPNCRIVTGVGPEGDCPEADGDQPMQCYALGTNNEALESLSTEVGFAVGVNGVCRIPEDGRCGPGIRGPPDLARCRAGFTCREGTCHQE